MEIRGETKLLLTERPRSIAVRRASRRWLISEIVVVGSPRNGPAATTRRGRRYEVNGTGALASENGLAPTRRVAVGACERAPARRGTPDRCRRQRYGPEASARCAGGRAARRSRAR